MTFYEYLCQFRWVRRVLIALFLIPSFCLLLGEGLFQKKWPKLLWIQLEIPKWKQFIAESWNER
jgi:hypothetical protein